MLEFLPEQLKQKGRFVYVTRNPKAAPHTLTSTQPGTCGTSRVLSVITGQDCLNSLHYFRGEAKDGWSGNEHGPGSMPRFLNGGEPPGKLAAGLGTVPCTLHSSDPRWLSVNAYGGFFKHFCDADDYMQVGSQMCCCVP